MIFFIYIYYHISIINIFIYNMTKKLELVDITDSFIRRKLGLLKKDEYFYKEKIQDFRNRPYHKRFDLGAYDNDTEKLAFINNKNICDIFKKYFENISFCVSASKGMGYFFIYPINLKKFYEKFDDDEDRDNWIKNVNGESYFKYLYCEEINGLGTTEIIEKILRIGYVIDKTITFVKEDVKNAYMIELKRNIKSDFKEELKKNIKAELIEELIDNFKAELIIKLQTIV